MLSRYIILFIFFAMISVLYPSAGMAQDKKDEDLAMMFFRERNFEKAASLYEKLYNSDPKYYYYTYYLYSLLELENYQDAEKLVKKHIRKNSDAPRFLVDLGYIYIRKGDLVTADKHFQDALSSLKASQRDVVDLANGFQSRQQNDYAIATYLRGRELLGSQYPFHLELARVYEQSGKYPEMMAEYVNELDRDPNQVKNVQNRLQSVLNNDRDNLMNDAFREEMLRRVQRYPDRTYYSEMLLWHSIQQKDFELAFLQAQSLDKRLKEDGDRVFELAQLSASNQDYNVAGKAYRYIVDKGPENPYYLEARIELLNVRYFSLVNSYDISNAELESLNQEYVGMIGEYGRNATTIPLIRNMAHLQAFYLHQVDEAIAILEDAVQLTTISPMLQAECKLELADIMLFAGEVWEATLLYSQVDKAFKNDPIGFLAKFRNAKLSFYIGEFDWARAQLDVLKAATSKLIANDAMDLSLLISDNLDMDSTATALKLFATASLLEFQNRDEDALLRLDSILSAYTYHPLHDEVLYKKSEIRMKQGMFAEADTLLAEVTEKFSFDILADNALYERAQLQEMKFGNKEKAMELYQKVLEDYPGSLFVVEARKRFRSLRGDPLN